MNQSGLLVLNEVVKQTSVLIIGGGFAGVSVAQKLSKASIETLLIDKKDYFEVTFATLRNVAVPNLLKDKARKKYSHFLSSLFIQSTVSELKSDRAILTDGTIIKFKLAVIASGTSYPTMPIAKSINALNKESRDREMYDFHKSLSMAKNILVLGGGVVGVELAGEIADAFPYKKITLAHRGSKLLDSFNSKTSEITLQQLTRIGVNVELNANYQEVDGTYIERNTNTLTPADLVLKATGVKPNNKFLRQNFSHILNEKGFIKVNEQLEVDGCSNLYALGDIADVGEPKLGYLAQKQGEYLAKSIIKKIKGKNTRTYKRNPLVALIPTGRRSGVVEHPLMVTTFSPLVNFKQKDLFISKVFKSFAP